VPSNVSSTCVAAGSPGFNTPLAIGRRTSALNMCANFSAALPYTTSSSPSRKNGTPLFCKVVSCSDEYGTTKKALS
jgi:hypothetical protein